MKQRISKAEQERLSNMFVETDVKCINGSNGDNSYLDQEAQFPFGKLKKVYSKHCTSYAYHNTTSYQDSKIDVITVRYNHNTTFLQVFFIFHSLEIKDFYACGSRFNLVQSILSPGYYQNT